MNTVPMVIKKTNDGERAMDIASRLLDDNIILLTGEINDIMAEVVMAQLLYLDSLGKEEPIHIYINSPGGSVTAGLAILDTMRLVKSKIYTYCIGLAASMGSILLSSGDKRYIVPHAEVMIHQPLGGTRGQATDIEIAAKHISRTKEVLNSILAENCGRTYEEVSQDTERDNWKSAAEALEYGLVDKIITKFDDMESEDS
ncbi:MAG: ATP-dependent Clp protease proteolytic subunit [Lachnospiraceae bacterium]|nr:ATP-dependent Clp protease proteolytic subunit [Lachnospiraceae bacterium]